MTVLDIVGYLATWSLIGAFLFNIYVLSVFRTGMVYTAREKNGTLMERPPLSGIINSLLLLALIVSLLVLSSLLGLEGSLQRLGFLRLFLLQYGLYYLLFLYDTYVIDYYVIGRWRPAILRIPDEMKAESMAEHIQVSMRAGPLIGIVLVAVSTALTIALSG